MPIGKFGFGLIDEDNSYNNFADFSNNFQKQAKILPNAADQIKSMASNCQTKENASDADVVSLLAGEFPSTAAGKCLHACMQETLGIVRTDQISSHKSNFGFIIN